MAPPGLATVDPTATPPELRRLPWPRVAPVDLVVEFPWLILHQRAADEWAERTIAESQATPDQDDEHDDGDHEGGRTTTAPSVSSVYAQALRAPRSPPRVWSPAQRAARKMLKLQDEMDRRDEYARLRAQAAASALPAQPRSPVRVAPAVAPTKPAKPTRETRAAARATATATPQARLQQWLSRASHEPLSSEITAFSSEMATRIHRKTHATLGAGLWADEVASPLAAELSSESVFGGYVATRRLALAHSTDQQPAEATPNNPKSEVSPKPPPETLTNPTTASTTHHTTEETQPTTTQSTTLVTVAPSPRPRVSPPRRAVSIVVQFADDVRDEAHALVAQGNVGDALATLQRGIDRVLRDFQDNADELRTRGFDYSALAHAMARRLQRAYKRRHRMRLRSLVRIQRVWRRTRGRRAYLASRAYLTSAACAIQRPYKTRFVRRKRERSAVRIQRCFRVFQSQKLLVWLHRACRLISTEQRRKRELVAAKKRRRRRLWVRLVVVLKMLSVVAQRRRRIALVQAQWRGRCARKAYAQVQTLAIEREAQRQRREDAFVEPRVAQFRDAMRRFYEETARGRALVGWRLRAPWLRWRRLRTTRSTGSEDQVAALQAMYAQRDGNGADLVLRGLEARCVGAVLRRRLVAGILRLREAATGSTSETQHPGTITPVVVSSSADDVRPSGLRRWTQRVTARVWPPRRRAQWTRWRTTAARSLHSALWSLLVFPKLQIATSGVFRSRRARARTAAVASLLADHERVARAVLRRGFRDHDGARPAFVCAWCGAGAATARLFYAHRHAGCATEQLTAERERAATAADVAHHERLRSQLRTKLRMKPSTRPHVVAVPGVFTEHAAFVRRVAARVRRWRRWRGSSVAALRWLVAAATMESPAGTVAAAPTELLAQLVFLLDDAGGHALERLHAATRGSARGTEERLAWIVAEDAARALGLDADGPATAAWQRPWQRLRALWTARRGSRYRPHARGTATGTATGSFWRRGVLARVVALA